jgi:radial spoke head protein 9
MEDLYFWGKLFGSENDYYIALGINFKNHYEFPQKLFYYAVSPNFVFSKLPETLVAHDKDNIDNYSNPIVGNPQLILKKYVEDVDPNDPVNDPNNNLLDPNVNPIDNQNNILDLDESLDEVKKVEEKKENFTELLKISYLVRNIDWDTSVFPKGAYRLLPIHELRKNESFIGLKKDELLNLNNYYHFRPITDPSNKELIETDEAIFRFDFLDSIANDQVKGGWSIQLDSTKTIVNNFITDIV